MAQASSLQRKNRRNTVDKNSVQCRLEGKLERAKRLTGLGHGLKVKWAPNPTADRHGEVKGNLIYVYDEDEEEALLTLKHELIDHHITKEILEPAVQYINIQKNMIETLLYKRKERVVDRLSKLL